MKQDLKDPIAAHFERSLAALQRTAQDAALLTTAREIAAAVIAALRSGNKLLIIGNGGSAADAQHIAAAIGTPTMGIFGPTSPYHWAPLNGLAATVQTKTVVSCQPCHRPVCTMNDHRCMREIPAADVVATAQRVLAEAEARVAR